MVNLPFDALSLYTLFGALVVLLVALALRCVPVTEKTVPVWAVAGLLGLFLGGGGTVIVMHTWGYHWRPAQFVAGGVGPRAMPSEGAPEAGGMPGMMAMNPMGGMQAMGGMPGMQPGGGGGGGGENRARRDLTTLVGKLELVTRGIQVKLDAEQSAKLASMLDELDRDDEMTTETAEKHLATLRDILTSEQQEALTAFDLPRRGGRGGAGGGGGGGVGAMVALPAGAPGGPSLSGENPDENPFKQEENQKRLGTLRDRLKGAEGAGAAAAKP